MHVKHANETMPPIDLIRGRIDYDPITGSLRWKHCGPDGFKDHRGWRIWLGKFAGHEIKKRNRGYVVVCFSVDGVTRYMQGHRVVWALMTGEWPAHEIDHVNGTRSDNRWENLRVATHKENQWNKGLSVRNKSGAKGVHRHTQTGMWVAQIRVSGQPTKTLGTFTSVELAAAAYRAASQELHKNFARVQ
jgi:hypothetical protein